MHRRVAVVAVVSSAFARTKTIEVSIAHDIWRRLARNVRRNVRGNINACIRSRAHARRERSALCAGLCASARAGTRTRYRLTRHAGRRTGGAAREKQGENPAGHGVEASPLGRLAYRCSQRSASGHARRFSSHSRRVRVQWRFPRCVKVKHHTSRATRHESIRVESLFLNISTASTRLRAHHGREKPQFMV